MRTSFYTRRWRPFWKRAAAMCPRSGRTYRTLGLRKSECQWIISSMRRAIFCSMADRWQLILASRWKDVFHSREILVKTLSKEYLKKKVVHIHPSERHLSKMSKLGHSKKILSIETFTSRTSSKNATTCSKLGQILSSTESHWTSRTSHDMRVKFVMKISDFLKNCNS